MKNRFKFYPSALIIGVLGGLIVGMFAFQPEPKASVPKDVPLEHVYHLPCRFEAEGYEPSTTINGMRIPMICGCSELKGTCHQTREIKYAMPE